MDALFGTFDQGTVIHGTEHIPTASLVWSEHKNFAGVFLKNLIAGEDTGGLLSCHLVRIEPNMFIGLHSHPDSMELHEVVAGSGRCETQNGIFPYAPGTISVIPRNMPHEVHAGENGLYLLAKFVLLKP
ncbi:MAG: cupin domain-containing protein [Betaproteobacteria bacterium]|nr:cupin domain-containing protein [Betaproteobacteria bacterium]